MLKYKRLALSATLCILSSSWSGVIAQSTPVEPPVQETTVPPDHVISGGTQVLDASSLANLTSITVAQGTTAIIDVANLSNIVLPGNFTNNGAVYFGSSIAGVQSANLTANNIFNQQGAVLSTTIPANLAGFNNASFLSLNLTAVNNIVNAGSISSSAALNMSAGGSIINALPTGVSGPSPLMQAANNVNLNASNIVNSGLIASSIGNINVAAQLAAQSLQNLNINSAAGTWQALAGSINLRDSSYIGNAITGLSGGNYLSDSLNINGGTGQVEVNIGKVTGRVSTSAHIAHVYADTSRLVLGEQCLTGDPTYANTGDIEIAGPIVISGAPLAIIAGGNIISTAADAQIVNNGGSVLLIAGANITGASAGGVGLTGTAPAGGTTGDITVSLSGGAGGNIDFAALTPGCINCVATTQNVAIDTSNKAGPGGDITLVALANGTTGGNVWLSTSNTTADIYSWSSATQPIITESFLDHGGSVNIFAGAGSGTSIRLADVYTSGNGGIGVGTQANSGPGTGALIIHTSQATTSDGKSLTINSLGNITSGNSIIPGALENAGIVAGVLNTAGAGASGFTPQAGGNGGYLQISAGASVSSDSILSFGAGGVTSGNGGRGGDINIAAGSLTVRGDINSSGGGAGGTANIGGIVQPGYGGSAGNAMADRPAI